MEVTGKIGLIVIDGQKDFVLPTGKLAVAGAVDDMDRVVNLINTHGSKINTVVASLDSHHALDISHPSWWKDSQGNQVGGFTPISYQDLLDGKYVPLVRPKYSIEYVRQLEEQGEFKHFIWPYHCLIGSDGAALYDPFSKSLENWEIDNRKKVTFVAKGESPYTEHYGIFRANIELDNDPSTHFNQDVITLLNENDFVLLAGQARSHCVANSVRQLTKETPGLTKKLVILTDCMSDVPGLDPGFYDGVNAIYKDAEAAGAQFIKVSSLQFN